MKRERGKGNSLARPLTLALETAAFLALSQPRILIMLALGIEGSANKVGVGIVAEDGTILANPRKT